MAAEGAPRGLVTRRLDVDGYPLAYTEAGAGTAVLFVHGSLGDCRVWKDQLAALAAGHRAIAVSLRHCHPDTHTLVAREFTVARHASDVAAFLEALRLAPAHVVGHSRGGAVAIELARRWPSVVRSLVLADPGGLEALLPDTPDGRAMARESTAMFERLRDDLATGSPEEAARHFVDTLGGPGAWQRRTPAQRQILLDNIATGPCCAERPHFDVATLASLPGPMLLVTGARSPPRYRLMLDAVRACNPAVADLVTIASAGHAMNRENPADFNAVLDAFLREVERRER